jgi:hypothetical protein
VIRFCRAVVAFVSRNIKSKAEIAAPSAPGPSQRLALFGPPLLIEGEDALYDQLVDHFCAVIKPVDIIDEMLIADLIFSELEVLRYRRAKWTLIRARGLAALADFLNGQLDQAMCSEQFVERLTEILEDVLPEDQVDFAHTMAQQCARNEPHALDKANQLLANREYNVRTAWLDAQNRKAWELVDRYARREPDAVTLVDKLVTEAGESMEVFMAQALAKKLGKTERIDRQITIAEGRRNASLREIDRRRAVLGQALRRAVQEIADHQFEMIETTPAEGGNAA